MVTTTPSSPAPEGTGRFGPTGEHSSIIRSVQAMRQASEDGRRGRLARNKLNRDVFLGRQDWSHKQPGQSSEFLPKVPVSVEQMGAFVKRALIQFGDWFSVTTDQSLNNVIDGRTIVALMKCFLENLWGPNGKTLEITNILSDVVKNGLMESLMILKVHGGMHTTRRARVERGSLELGEDGSVRKAEPSLSMEEVEEWRLRVDFVRPEDYYPDPTGNGLYEIHRVERDLHEVLKSAEDGMYDMEAVQELIGIDYARPDDEARTDKDRDQDETTNPSFRRRVVLDEFWGTLLNEDGTIQHRNVVCTIANDRIIIRPPEPNPFWHQESPFIAEPIVRVPWSVWHKALYDHASQLNLAINEMFNLMLDGGMAAVWGVRQIRVEDLEDPSQVSNGVPMGATLAVKSTLPHGQKVMDVVTEGNVPQDAMAVFEFLNREFTQAALTNELKLGSLPAKQVRATEIVEASQSQAITLDGLVADIESSFIAPLLRKAWLVILQNADRIPQDVLLGLFDKRAALIIQRSSPAERFALFSGRCKFKVHGLSGTTARMRDFQRMMALLQVVNQSPMLFQAFMRRFSSDRALMHLIRTLQLNPESLEKTHEELEQFDEEMARTIQAGQILGQQGGRQGGLGGNAGQPGLTAEVNQNITPATGQPTNA